MQMNNTDIENKKIPLSNRMQAILRMLQSEVVEHGMIDCLADIGCDHAFVSMACIENHLADHVIAMDVRKGPLEIARTHIKEYGFEKSVETRMSDGFEALKQKEASWAVLAGMGGELMRRILENGKNHLMSGIGLILQPQSEIPVVRMYLQEQNYIIVDEDFLQEEGKFYTIIKAKKRTDKLPDNRMNELELQYGSILLKKENPVFLEYLYDMRNKMHELQKRLETQQTDSSKRRYEELKQELCMIQQAIDVCVKGQ